MKTRRLAARRLLLAAGLFCAVPALAQTFPAKPIRITIAFAAPGPSDILARAVAERLQSAWGQPVVVEARTGANGNIGMEFAAKQAPDGYNLIVVPVGNAAINPHLFPKLPYDIFKDFEPVTMLATVELVLAVNPALPAKSVKELVALARARPGVMSFASPGVGSTPHIAGELFKSLTGLNDLIHVPYKGAGQATMDVVGGQVTMMFSQLPTALPFTSAGKLRPLGIASPKRSPSLPDVPTIAEQGLKGYEALSWFLLMAPAGTPREIVNRLSAETTRGLQSPETRERLRAQGVEAVGGSPEDAAAWLKRDFNRLGEVIRKAGIKVEQ